MARAHHDPPGGIEVTLRRAHPNHGTAGIHAWPLLAPRRGHDRRAVALSWVAFKVGALPYGGGFVIIPLTQHDAVHTYHWMADGQFLNAVALGQVTPGAVVQTIAVVGCASARPRRRSRLTTRVAISSWDASRPFLTSMGSGASSCSVRHRPRSRS